MTTNKEHEEEVDDVEDEESEDELMDDSNINDNEKLNFDFEAFPPCPDDADQINNLLTQIFLRTDIDYDNLSKEVAVLGPLGSVIKTAEDFVDEDNEEVMYGVSSVILLTSEKNYGIGNLLAARSNKNAEKTIANTMERVFKDKVGFVINERMLHFPAQIAGPTLNALKNDIKNDKILNGLETFLMLLKIRSQDDNHGKGDNKKLGDVEYDNDEEALLFEANQDPPKFFDYPVHSDVESTSKFHIIKRGSTTLRPYRRVCILNKSQLFAFIDKVVTAFS